MKSLIYAMKVWLTTCIVSPIVLFLFFLVNDTLKIGETSLLFVSIFVGLILSIPAMIIFGYFFNYLRKRFSKNIQILILSLISLLVILLISWLALGLIGSELLLMTLSYFLTMFISMIIFYPKTYL